MRKLLTLLFLVLLIPMTAFSAPMICETSDIQVNFVRPLDQAQNTALETPVHASACLGAYIGNNSLFSKPKEGNLGYKDDGWLNIYQYGAWFPLQGNSPNRTYTTFWNTPGAFIDDEDKLQDLRTEGTFVDPGWIRLGKDDGEGFVGDKSTKDELTYDYEDNLLTFSNCKDSEGKSVDTCIGNEAVSGDWSLNPPTTSPEILFDILGGDFFDQLTVVLKGGNSFVMYTFLLSDFGLPPILPGDVKIQFGGTFDLSKTLDGRAISNAELWGRDPITGETTQVPEPASLMLLTFGLLLLAGMRRRAYF